MMTACCCAECGKEEEGGGNASLKTCKSCMSAKYCNAACQKNHWATHKKVCKQRAAELHDEALFKDPPAKEDCPICFLPMPHKLISCISLPPATISSVPIFDFAIANEELAERGTEEYYACCGKTICQGCIHSFCESGNMGKCPFCNSDRDNITIEQQIEEIRRRVAANDPTSIYLLAHFYYMGIGGFPQDHAKAIELYSRSANFGCSAAHNQLGGIYYEGGYLKKAKFHYESAAMAGCEVARCDLGGVELQLGNMERAVKHWMIAASAGSFRSMHNLLVALKDRKVSRESIDSTLTAYNDSCVEMRSEARDAYISATTE